MKEVKAMTKLQRYAVVTLHRIKDECEDTHTMFLCPGAYLKSHIASHLDEGWTLYSVLLCDKETYLNAKVDALIDSYEDTVLTRERLHQQFKTNVMDLDSYMTALTITNELEIGDLRQLHHLMGRMTSEGVTCHNTKAIQLYKMVF